MENVHGYARELVAACVDLPGILDSIGDDDDLVSRGVDSGEILNVALRCEQVLGRSLTDGELSRLTSISAVAELVQTAVP